MRAHVFGRLLTLALLFGACATPTIAQGPLPWWKDPKVVQQLMLTPEQSTKVDTIFRATIDQLRQYKAELDKQEAELSHLLEINADEATAIKQIDKVEAARATLNKSRTLMLRNMRQILTPKQNAKFNAVFEQYRRDNPRPPERAPEAIRPPTQGTSRPGK